MCCLFRRRKELLGQQFQPRVGHRAAVPAGEDELLPLKTLPEPPVDLRLRVFQGQPPLHVVAVVALRIDRTDHHQRQQEHEDRHDPHAETLVEVAGRGRHRSVFRPRRESNRRWRALRGLPIRGTASLPHRPLIATGGRLGSPRGRPRMTGQGPGKPRVRASKPYKGFRCPSILFARPTPGSPPDRRGASVL